jgi:agmatinase
MTVFPVSKIVRSPGSGLLSFTTGSGKAKQFLGEWFDGSAMKDWQTQLPERIKAQQGPFSIIGFPSDCGGGICRGTAHGPLHLRKKLYEDHPEWVTRDLGDIPCIPHLLHDVMLSDRQRELSGKALWNDSFEAGSPVSPLNLLEEFLVELYRTIPDFRPLVLGGDHSTAGAIFEALHREGRLENCAVLQFDAHTDLLESRFGVENCFATWTANAIKRMPDPKRFVQIGIRASGFPKQHWESKFGLRQHWAEDLLSLDPAKYAAELVADLKARGCDCLYISNDIDGTDKQYAPSTGTPEGGGMTPDWAAKVIEVCTSELKLIGADMVEVAPVIGSPADGELTVATATRILEAHQWH